MKTPTRNWGINIFYWADDSLETVVSSVEKKEKKQKKGNETKISVNLRQHHYSSH